MAFTRNPSIDDTVVFNWLLVKDSTVAKGSRYLPLGAVTSVNVQPGAQGYQVSLTVQGESVAWGDADDEASATDEAMGLIERINSVYHPQAMAGLTPLA
jgi:hypothetical protein